MRRLSQLLNMKQACRVLEFSVQIIPSEQSCHNPACRESYGNEKSQEERLTTRLSINNHINCFDFGCLNILQSICSSCIHFTA